MSSRSPLHVCVGGAGIAGLSQAIALARIGIKVSVYEGSSQLSEIGAGIRAYPNASRILLRWGLLKDMEKVGMAANETMFRRYSNGKVLAHLRSDAKEVYGAP